MPVIDLYINGLFWKKENVSESSVCCGKIYYSVCFNINNSYNNVWVGIKKEGIELYEVVFNIKRQYVSKAEFNLNKERCDFREYECSSADYLYIKNVAHCYDPLIYVDRNNELCVRNDIEIVKKEVKNKKYNDKNKNKVFLLDLDD